MMNIEIKIFAETPQEARSALQGLLNSTSMTSVATETAPASPGLAIKVPEGPITDEQAKALVAASHQRERGKAAPGSTRRTKAEIAEDEAADAADAAVKKAGDETGAVVADKTLERGNISDGSDDRRDPNNPDDVQDDADEAAETAASTTKLTHDDVRNALGKYVKAYGMPAAQEDGPKLIAMVLDDKTKAKISDLPDDQEVLAKAIAGVEEMLAKNPFGRKADL